MSDLIKRIDAAILDIIVGEYSDIESILTDCRAAVSMK